MYGWINRWIRMDGVDDTFIHSFDLSTHLVVYSPNRSYIQMYMFGFIVVEHSRWSVETVRY